MHADRFVEMVGALVEYRKYFLWLQVACDEQRVQAHEYGAATSAVCMQRDAPILHANILASTHKIGPEK